MNDKNQLPVSVEDTNLLGKDINIIKCNIKYHTGHQRLWSKSKCTQSHKNKNQHQRHNMSKKKKVVPVCNTVIKMYGGIEVNLQTHLFFF